MLGVGVLCDVPRPRHHGQAARHRPHHLQQVQPAAGGGVLWSLQGGILTLAARRSSSCSRASWRRAAAARWTRCRGGPAAAPGGRCTPSPPDLHTRASNEGKICEYFTITEKAPTRAFSWLKSPTSAFTFKTLLRHYAKRALTPRSLNVKLGPRHKSHKGRAVLLA